MAEAQPVDRHEALMAMLKRRGFIQPAYELYGGLAGFYDYGPLGQGLKNRFETLWRRHYVVDEGFGEISCPSIGPEPVFVASGHVGAFKDTIVLCPQCGAGFRGDHFVRDEMQRFGEAIGTDWAARVTQAANADPGPANIRTILEGAHAAFGELPAGATLDAKSGLHVQGKKDAHWFRCLSCATPLTPEIIRSRKEAVAPFNLMFKTSIGPGSGKVGYLRPETAQSMFVNFQWLYRYEREHVPFGAVQIGRAYRNEIAPRQGLLRQREFWQAEAEVFVDPADKRHPRFAEVAAIEANLVPHGHEGKKTVKMSFGDAVKKGVIANETLAYFVAKTQRVLVDAGLDPARIRFRQHEKDEMAHYAADCWDAEFHSARFDWVECVGIADRGSYDLESHEKHSGQRLQAFRRFDQPREADVTRAVPDMKALGPLFKGKAKLVADAMAELDASAHKAGEPLLLSIDGEELSVPASAFKVEHRRERVTGEWFTPHVIEPSYGVDRILSAALEHAFEPKKDANVLHLEPWMAPIQVGLFPLLNKDGLPEKAHEIARSLKDRGLVVDHDESGSIGRRYARQDEVGTPYCVTVDHETLEKGTVTIRERDTQEQVRVKVEGLDAVLEDLVRGRTEFGVLKTW